jgi:AraC-like DNA-binding protein
VIELPTTRKPLKLAWSEAIVGAELYDGEDVQTFSTGWHFHEGWQLVAVTKGKRHYQFREGSIIAKPGQLVLVPPRVVHRARCLDEGKTSFKIATLPAVGLTVQAPAAPISWPTPKLFGDFISVFESLKADGNHEPQAATLDRLEMILRESRATGAQRNSAPPLFVRQIESYLLTSLDNVPSLDSISSMAGVSRYHFAHAFSKYIGLSPLAFHTRARLLRARKLISQGWSLADTSHSLSFSDQSHFGRQFRKVYGMTPGAYQENIAAGVHARPLRLPSQA